MKYAKLFDQVQQELARMKRVVAKNQAYLKILDTDQDDPTAFELDIAGIAMNLQGFYTGAERIFLGIARDIDDYVPRGDAWHKQLLTQMLSDIPGIRPAVIDEETWLDLNELRGFRHFIRNSYSDDLDSDKVYENAERLARCYTHLQNQCIVFQQRMVESS